MTQIHVNCTDQVLTVTSRPLIASGGRNEERVNFTFCSKWDGHIKTAVFYRQEDEVYHVLLDDDSCVIPHEVLASPGKLYIGVFGIRGDVTRTSSLLSYLVGEGAITEATAVSDPTPDIYAQILDRLNELETNGGTGSGGSCECPADIERTTNRVTVINEKSDDNHYPTAKAVFDVVGNIEDALDGIVAIQESYISGEVQPLSLEDNT